MKLTLQQISDIFDRMILKYDTAWLAEPMKSALVLAIYNAQTAGCENLLMEMDTQLDFAPIEPKSKLHLQLKELLR